jgi:hypothetical protein
MSFSHNLISKLLMLGTILVAPTAAQFPKRGLAANDDIPIWQFGGTWVNPSHTLHFLDW